MVVKGISNVTKVYDIFDFIRSFKLEDKFFSKYAVKIDNWDYRKTDGEVIEEMLEDEREEYVIMYHEEDEGSFEIIML